MGLRRTEPALGPTKIASPRCSTLLPTVRRALLLLRLSDGSHVSASVPPPYSLAVTVVGWAYELAESLLCESLPRRWQHSQGVATCARRLAPLVEGRSEVLEAAAVLHDIGYTPAACRDWLPSARRGPSSAHDPGRGLSRCAAGG